MANVCPSCGAENRDKARFCRGCAQPLDSTGEGHEAADPAAEAARARRRARRHRQTKAHRPAWSRWAGVMVAAVIALGAGWWLGVRQTTPAPAQAAPPPVAAVPVAAPILPPPTVASPAGTDAEPPVEPAPTAAEAAVDRLRNSVEELEQQDRARAAARAQQARLAQERLRADEARRKTDALAASAAAASSAAASAPGSAGVAPASVPAPTAAANAAPPSIDQLCAGSGNFLARDFCRIRECGKPSFAKDPVCVRFRQMDEARRQQSD